MASELDLASHARGRKFNPCTAQIPLTQGKFALVDALDYPALSQFKWRLLSPRRPYVVTGYKYKNNFTFLHRLLLNPPKTHFVDHINGNSLDNQRSNLRICTHAENMRNRKKHKHSKYPFKGIEKINSRWYPRIRLNGKRVRLGGYGTAEEAAKAYDAKARDLFGPYARFNFPQQVAA